MSLLWWLVPEDLWLWVLLALGVAWLLRLVPGRTFIAALALSLAWPYVESWLGTLPVWLQYALLALLALAFLRDLLAFFLGDRAADHAVGDFTGWLLRAAFLAVTLPFRTASRVLRWTTRALTDRMP